MRKTAACDRLISCSIKVFVPLKSPQLLDVYVSCREVEEQYVRSGFGGPSVTRHGELPDAALDLGLGKVVVFALISLHCYHVAV